MTGRSGNNLPSRGKILRIVPICNLLIIFTAVFIATDGLAGPNAKQANTPDSQATNEIKLKQLRDDIAALSVKLASNLDEKQSMHDQLGLLERRIGKFVTIIHGISKKIDKKNSKLGQLRKDHQTLKRSLGTQKKALSKQVLAAYIMGRQQYVKLLLNQQDPASISRTLQYHSYFNRARIGQIDSAKTTINTLDVLQTQIEKDKDSLKSIRKSQLSDQQHLESDRKKRLLVLASLDSQIAKKGSALKNLRNDEKRLAELIKQITAQIVNIPALNNQPNNFRQLRGKLPWPIDGKLVAKFGAARNSSDIKWRGILISAKQNKPVQAISHGRVAFADWLRGFGQLLIIEHGNGYMSLYGQNEGLYKEVGDWVTAKETIATIGKNISNKATGNSINGKNKGLYFEIRRNGKPINPLNWLMRRPK